MPSPIRWHLRNRAGRLADSSNQVRGKCHVKTDGHPRRNRRRCRLGSGPPDFCSCTLKVPRSAVGSSSGRPEPARPMSQLGRTSPFRDEGGKVWNRRVSPVAPRRGEGPLTEPTPAVRPRPGERLFMPHTCRSRYPPGSAQLGGNGPSTHQWSLTVAALSSNNPRK
jgi:hypothetical protein